MENKQPKRLGDRRDGRLVRDGKGLQSIMCHLMPNRTDNEVYIDFGVDATNLLKYLEEKNKDRSKEERISIFHCILIAIARMVRERPQMNRFIQGRRMYDRNEISLSFVAKRRFEDHGDEALMYMIPDDNETIDTFSKKIRGDVSEIRKQEHASDGLDRLMDNLAKTPRPFLMSFIKSVRVLDFWGKNPKVLTTGDPNYSSVLVSNLGSIKCPAVYHHLNNYGTNSIMVTIGAIHKEPLVMEDGSIEARDVITIGATLDERIGDGFYFVRSLKLIEHIIQNPELLDVPLCVPSEYNYE